MILISDNTYIAECMNVLLQKKNVDRIYPVLTNYNGTSEKIDKIIINAI
jgi:hypothetical protein